MSILVEPARVVTVQLPDLEVDCTLSTVVGDAVYIAGNNLVAPAKADSQATMPAIGVVQQKLTSTTCKVRRLGETTIFSGLTPGANYRVSETVAGAITKDPPPAPGALPVFVYQSVGWGVSSTNFAVDPDPSDRIVVF